jgi:hypothetical protein
VWRRGEWLRRQVPAEDRGHPHCHDGTKIKPCVAGRSEDPDDQVECACVGAGLRQYHSTLRVR